MARGLTTDEHRPLLQAPQDEDPAEHPVTPLPKLQLSVLLLVLLAEPMTSQVIYPFINQLVSELDITKGDPKKVGYYAGLIESLFFATQAMFIYSITRASDHVGRKPVILFGLGGIALSMISFGLSKTFWGLVVSRSLAGLLNGNIGVIKAMMAELTDSTNMALGFSFMPIVWSSGATIGPIIGGVLTHPYDRFPTVFRYPFWNEYPYLLPCLFSAFVAAFAFLMIFFFLKETVHKSTNNASMNSAHNKLEGPLPLRDLMTRPILLSIANYGLICLADICFFALQPLFYSTPIELGGLGFDTPTIGMCLAVFGLMNGTLQLLFFPRIVKRLGPRRVAVMGNFMFFPVFVLFPVMARLARAWGVSPAVWALLILQMLLVAVMAMAFSAVFMFVASSAPNKRSLGSVNGMAQTIGSIARAIGPAVATSLFAFSLQTHWLGGNAIYLVLMVVPCLTISFAIQLPHQLWEYSNL